MEESSTLENIGQSNLYSFHNFISLGFPHLHLTECKPGLISIAQPFLQLEHTGKKTQLQWPCTEIKHYQVRKLARVKALFCCMARSQVLGAREVPWSWTLETVKRRNWTSFRKQISATFCKRLNCRKIFHEKDHEADSAWDGEIPLGKGLYTPQIRLGDKCRMVICIEPRVLKLDGII